MPELPEVQTVVSQLAAKVVGLTVVDFCSEWTKAVRPSMIEFKSGVIGAKIVGVRRFGKHIVIDLVFHRSSDEEGGRGEVCDDLSTPSQPSSHLRGRGIRCSIVIHLKMTGHLLVKTQENENTAAFRDDPYNGYIRHTLLLSEGTRIEFSDMRKFGWLEVMSTDEVERLKSIRELGIDALSENFTLKYFRKILEKKSAQVIGIILLEQHFIAGIGNIYRNEALFRAGILPMRKAGTLTESEVKKLLLAIRTVLREAVELRGMSDGDFRDTEGRMGEFEENAFVYGRENLPCKKCGTMIIRAKLGQRSVFFCPQCQQ